MWTLVLLLQVVPEERTADWARAGLPPLPARTRVVEVQGDPQAAIDAAEPDSILFLPEGTYDGLRLKSRITLRGAGPSKTILKGPISIGAGGADWWYPNRLKVDVQGRRGEGALRVADASKLKPGMVVQLSRKNDPAVPVISPSGHEFLQRQVTQIVSKTDTHVTVSPAPLFDLPEGSRLAPAGRMAEFVGVEDLAVEDSGRFGIHMAGVYGCWVRNVSVRFVTYSHIAISDALFCEVRGCTIATRSESGADGAGIQLGTSSFCKIEDNVLVEQYPHIEVNASSGNVIAYNYCRDSDIYGQVGPSIASSPGPHSCFNLYEGNVAPKFQADGYQGGASHDTVFRNRLHGTSMQTSKRWICVYLKRFARDYSIVGNVLGAPGHAWHYDDAETGGGDDPRRIFSFGLPGNGPPEGTQTRNAWKDWGTAPGAGGFRELDLDVRRTAIVKGNWNYRDQGVPPQEAVAGALPASLYLKAKPAWWGDLAWPPFGPDTDFARNKIPAELRR
jgi:hypothetical protein